jgi:hypothetical protein
MKHRSFANLTFLAVTLLLLTACSAAIAEEIPSTAIPEETRAPPILSTALDRDCEFKQPTGDKLVEGNLAVDFNLKDVHGNEYTLSELLSEKPVVLISGSYT